MLMPGMLESHALKDAPGNGGRTVKETMPVPGENPLSGGQYFELSTEPVAADQRWEFWRDTVLNRSDADIRPGTPREFSAKVLGYISGRAELRDGRSDAVILRRRATRCRRDGGDEILLSAIVSTDDPARYQNNSTAFKVPAGRFLINDMSVPFEIEMARYRSINFRLPRAAVPRAISARPGDLTGRLLPESALASLLFSQLVRLADALPAMDGAARQMALGATADFALGVLRLEARPDPGATSWDDGAHWSGLWLAAERFIERNLDNAALSPDTLARVLQCSRTQLYRLFARHDVAVMDHIRDMRLNRCRDMLADPACQLPIAEIAALCGMDNPSAFSRGFRRRFGCSPGEMRREARERLR
jgi:AraC family transcriptional activator of tynA and feaB